MISFDKMMARILGHEGGFTRNPLDRGNWDNGILKGTKFGISARSYPHIDIKNLTYEKACKIYYQDYYLPLKPSKLPNAITFQLLDYAINSGVYTASKALQRLVGVKVDGQIGPITAEAVAKEDTLALGTKLLGCRLHYMTRMPAWKSFNKGWSRRIADNLYYLDQDTQL